MRLRIAASVSAASAAGALSDHFVQFIRVYRLDQVRVETGRCCSLSIALRAITGHRNDVSLEVSVAQLLRDLMPRHPGQSDIQQHDIRCPIFSGSKGTYTITRSARLMAPQLQKQFESLSRIRIVVHDQNPQE